MNKMAKFDDIIVLMCYDVPNKNHLKLRFLVLFIKIVVFSTNSFLYIELSICPLNKNVSFYVCYLNNNEDMAI